MRQNNLFLLLFLVVILLLLGSCSGDNITSDSTAVKSENNAPVTTSLPIIGTENDKDGPLQLNSAFDVCPSEQGVTIPSSSYITGTLLAVNEYQLYRYGISSLCPASGISSSVSIMKEQGLIRLYGNKSQNYTLASSQIFLKEDAFQPWENLMAAFVAQTGKKTVQIVSAYVYSDDESLASPYVTGYALAVNLYENGANYSLASPEKTVTVNGKTMTCLDWFQDNCVKFGFVYTGLEGSQAKTLATFYYVGIPHALAMQRLDYVDVKEYSNFLRYYSSVHTVTDFDSGITWTIDYYPAETDKFLTKILIPKGAVYTVSGDNIGGFVVAYYIPQS